MIYVNIYFKIYSLVFGRPSLIQDRFVKITDHQIFVRLAFPESPENSTIESTLKPSWPPNTNKLALALGPLVTGQSTLSLTNSKHRIISLLVIRAALCISYVNTLRPIQNDRHFTYDDVIKWKHFPRYWPFVPGIHRSPVNSPHKGQWRGALMFNLVCVWINGWVNNRETGDLRPYRVQLRRHCNDRRDF